MFTPDAFIDYSSAGAAAGSRDEIAAWLEQGLSAVPMTQHFITNMEIDLHGDRAKVRAMFYNPMQLPGMAELSYCGGYYHHDLVRTPEGWKSERLVELANLRRTPRADFGRRAARRHPLWARVMESRSSQTASNVVSTSSAAPNPPRWLSPGRT